MTCSRCPSKEVRALGLCNACYCRAYRSKDLPSRKQRVMSMTDRRSSRMRDAFTGQWPGPIRLHLRPEDVLAMAPTEFDL
jgi:hypothetical protein